MKQLDQVKLFHKTFGQPILDKPQIPSIERCQLRYDLIAEELEELKEAYLENDIVGVADALTDLLYVVLGSHNEFGLHGIAEKLFDEVQRSNMSKLDVDGNVLYKENGKVMKSDLYTPPNLKIIVDQEIHKASWTDVVEMSKKEAEKEFFPAQVIDNKDIRDTDSFH